MGEISSQVGGGNESVKKGEGRWIRNLSLWDLWEGMSLCPYLPCNLENKGIMGILKRDVAVLLPPNGIAKFQEL